MAAVANGADAVYLGGKMFSARASAGNFDRAELVQALQYAHLRGVKVYVTVNTLLAAEELPEALEFLYFLQQNGADAALVQDLGLIRLARQNLPELPLYASTQMTVHNLATALFLRDCGIERLVLAREMSLAGIEAIVRAGGVETEIFVHGALCFCYSGQCLLSSLIGGRSGNRGRCAQPCRLPYTLVDQQGNNLAEPQIIGAHLLSPRDLNLARHLPALCQAGITSLKIEGRMKRPEYVATVVRVYRTLLDRLAAGGGADLVRPEEARDLEQIFNRDFTAGYLYQNPGRQLMSYKRPNNRGLFLGRVKGFDKTSRLAELQLEQPLRKGDGLEVWITQRGRAAGKVGLFYRGNRPVTEAAAGETIRLELPGRVFVGDRVFKTHDSLLVQKARVTYAAGRENKKIPLRFTASVTPGEPFRLSVADAAGNTATATGKTLGQPALKTPLTEEFLRRQLGRLGNTPFTLEELRCHLPEPVITPVGEINEVRRQALAALAQRRIDAARPCAPVSPAEWRRRWGERHNPQLKTPPTAGPGLNPPPVPSLSVMAHELAAVEAAVREGAGLIYFGGEQYRFQPAITPEIIRKAAQICRAAGAKLILSAPRVLPDREMDWFTGLIEAVGADYLDGIMATNLGQLQRWPETLALPIYSDISLSVFNQEAAAFLREAGVVQVTLSPELTLAQISSLGQMAPVATEVLVHGAVPVMVSEHCPPGSVLGGPEGCGQPCLDRQYALQDRKQYLFPLAMDQFCRMHLFNAKELCLLDDLAALAAAGVAALRVEARAATPSSVSATVKAYRAVLNQLPNSPDPTWLAATKANLAQFSPTGFTKGHLYRGV